MDRCIILVDAGYLLGATATLLGNDRARSSLQIDYAGMIAGLCAEAQARSGLPVLRVLWYDASFEAKPTPEHRMLSVLPDVKVRLGVLFRSGGKIEQKGVDSYLQRDLTTLARHRAVSDVILVGGDEDLRRGVDEAQDYGVRIHLWGVEAAAPEYNQSRALIAEADRRWVLSRDWVSQFVSLRPWATATLEDQNVEELDDEDLDDEDLDDLDDDYLDDEDDDFDDDDDDLDDDIDDDDDDLDDDDDDDEDEDEDDLDSSGAPRISPSFSDGGIRRATRPASAVAPTPGMLGRPTTPRPAMSRPGMPASASMPARPVGHMRQPEHGVARSPYVRDQAHAPARSTAWPLERQMYEVPRLSDVSTQRQIWEDNEQDATSSLTSATEVGERYGSRWAERASLEQLIALWDLRPSLPRSMDGELLRYANNQGIDTWEDEAAKFEVRGSVWRAVERAVAEIGNPKDDSSSVVLNPPTPAVEPSNEDVEHSADEPAEHADVAPDTEPVDEVQPPAEETPAAADAPEAEVVEEAPPAAKKAAKTAKRATKKTAAKKAAAKTTSKRASKKAAATEATVEEPAAEATADAAEDTPSSE